jgi:PAS domain S-box-containing protein
MTKAIPKLLSIGTTGSSHAAILDALNALGFKGDRVESLDDNAFARLSADAYGLVLIECTGLDAKAQEICERLKQSYPKIPLLLTVADGIETQASPAFDALIDGLLVKPFAPIELTTLARTLLRLNACETAVSAPTSLDLPSEIFDARVAALYDASIDAIVSIDEDDVITAWNPMAEQLSGFPAAEIIGKKLDDLDGSPEAIVQRNQYLQHLHQGEPIEYQAVRKRKDGEEIEVWVRGAPIKAKDGKSIGATFFVRDITALKKREQHVHFLMRELTHRSKNLLAVIQAMARQSLSHLNSPEDFVTRFSARLSGLAGSHDLLSNVDWEGASLVDLIRSQLRHYEDRFDEKIHIDGPDLFLRPEAAQNIGIALHELSTNAAKYGALSVPDGSVAISWTLKVEKDIQRLSMTWHEKGGPTVAPPTRKGFGHIVMDRITGQALGGTSHADFNADGVTWTLDVPAASVVLEHGKRA